MHFGHRGRVIFVLALLLTLLWMPCPAAAQGGTHVVQRGQTLSSIALRYGTTVGAIMRANGLTNSNFVWVGQRLRIPSPGSGGAGTATVHVVRRGQTLSSIAARYGTTIGALMQANGLRNRNFVWVGQRLRIPGRSGGGGGGGTAVHVVQRGQTLSSIALRYGTTVSALMQANGLRNRNFVWVGQRLRIPGRSSGGGLGSTGPTSGPWIEVILSSQQTIAWQGNVHLRTMVVSTGLRYPTPPGRFRIYSKYPSVTMSGPGYYLPGVPHTMFFYRGYALHGTYWHSNFGRPMSHGCVNLTRADAAWLYSWAPVGTLVVVHY